jgi:erlin
MIPFLVAAVGILISMPFGIHTIKSGHVGVYYRGGKLLDETSNPGFNAMMRFLTSGVSLQGSRGPNWTPGITGWTPDM